MAEVNLSFWRALQGALGVTYRHALQNPLRLNYLTAAVLTVIFAVHALDAGPLVSYHRAAVEDGAWWRLLTPLFGHASNDHLAWNAITMAAAGIVSERISRLRYAATLFLSAVVLGLVVHFGMPQVGASGTAAAVFTFILLRLSVLNWRIDPWVAIVACGILAAWGSYEAGLWGQRTPWEVFTGISVHGDLGHKVSPYHLIGMLTAVPIALWPSPRARTGLDLKAAHP
jgi:membrane associated rhomboid family serine protease